MTLSDIDEATGIVRTLLTALLGTLSGSTGILGAAFRYAVGDLQSTAATRLRSGAFGAALLNCFDLAFAAGASLTAMDAVRLSMQAETPSGLPAVAVVNAGIRFALVEEARILAAATFPSSSDVFDALSTVNTAFEAAEDYAADNRDPATYQALIALHAAVVRDLTTRACALPNLVTYAVPAILTSHALANRLYGDASRCDDLRAENQVIHPAFMPLSGTALSE